MGKRKLITGGLVFLVIILCLITFYLLRQNSNMAIAYNRADRELISLKSEYSRLNGDYEKLYQAYYEYEIKIRKLLSTNENVLWAKDSSAYIIDLGKQYVFAFAKKPKIQGEYFLWPLTAEKVELYGRTTDEVFPRLDYCFRVDTLKPHQFIVLERYSSEVKDFTIAPKLKNGYPDYKQATNTDF